LSFDRVIASRHATSQRGIGSNPLATVRSFGHFGAMDVITFISRIRDHYIQQFQAFAADQRRNCKQGAAEVKLQLDEGDLFQRLYCADFIKNDGDRVVVELQPESVLAFEPFSIPFGAASLSIEHLRWDDVLLYHDVAELPPQDLANWFHRWFDPNDERFDRDAPLSNVIHSLLVKPGVLSIDFGSAAIEALRDLLELIEAAGATAIRVSSSRQQAPGSA
jgi:hypothetical protein